MLARARSRTSRRRRGHKRLPRSPRRHRDSIGASVALNLLTLLLLSPSPNKNLARKSRVDSLVTRRSLRHSKKMVSISQRDPPSSRNLSKSAIRVISLSSVISKKLSSNKLRLQWADLLPNFLLLLELLGLKISLRVSRRTKRKMSLSLNPRDLLSLPVQ